MKEDIKGGKRMEENILTVMSKMMTRERLDQVIVSENKYREKDREMGKLSKQLREYDFTREQRQAIDRLLSAGNACCARYGELAYQQGAKDVVSILREFDLIKAV